MVERPRWVEEKTECNFCRDMMEVDSIEVRGEDVYVFYKCNNPSCYHMKLFGKPQVFTMIYYGRKTQYEKATSTNSEEQNKNFWSSMTDEKY